MATLVSLSIIFARFITSPPQEYVSPCNAIHGGKTWGRYDDPTCSWFGKKFFVLLDRQFGGHSARAGGAMFYASLSVTEDVIQALGRWSSHIRAESQLAALHLHFQPLISSYHLLHRCHPPHTAFAAII